MCRDPGDDKFIWCALTASADCIVSGDKDFCDLGQYKAVKIISSSDFLKKLDYASSLVCLWLLRSPVG